MVATRGPHIMAGAMRSGVGIACGQKACWARGTSKSGTKEKKKERKKK